jgi:amiloride-sensitive sodium channel
LGERKRHWSERAFWLAAFILAVYGCGNLIINIYNKWQQTPVIVSFAEKSTPVWSVPFPAVTVCKMTEF